MDFFAVFYYTDRRNCEINFSARFFIMLGLGTIINCAGILLGGFFGLFAERCGHPERQEALQKACGIAVLFIGISGAMAGMLQVGGSALSSGKAMLVALSLALGTVLGELLSLEAWFARLGKWLRDKTGSSGDPRFIDAFVTASLTVCIGAMSIVGAIQDGVSRDYSTLAVKAVLDCVIIAVMTASLGKGCIFSAIPVFVLEGAVTLLAQLLAPALTELAVSYLSLIGSILIFCVGVNLVWGKLLRVANMLPAILFAIAFSYLPWSF